MRDCAGPGSHRCAATAGSSGTVARASDHHEQPSLPHPVDPCPGQSRASRGVRAGLPPHVQRWVDALTRGAEEPAQTVATAHGGDLTLVPNDPPASAPSSLSLTRPADGHECSAPAGCGGAAGALRRRSPEGRRRRGQPRDSRRGTTRLRHRSACSARTALVDGQGPVRELATTGVVVPCQMKGHEHGRHGGATHVAEPSCS